MKRMFLVMFGGSALFAVAYVYLGATLDRSVDPPLKLSGNIEAHESVVSFKVQGRIVELPIEVGRYVKQGELLARPERWRYTTAGDMRITKKRPLFPVAWESP